MLSNIKKHITCAKSSIKTQKRSYCRYGGHEQTKNLRGYFVYLRRAPLFSNMDDVKEFVQKNGAPLPSSILRNFVNNNYKKRDWVLEYDDESSSEEAAKALYMKRFGMHVMKPVKTYSTQIVPTVSENPDTTVYISNVPPTLTKAHMSKLLEHKIPGTKVRAVRVMMDEKTNRSIGTAFITFENEEDAVLASIHLNGEMIRGKSLEVIPLA